VVLSGYELSDFLSGYEVAHLVEGFAVEEGEEEPEARHAPATIQERLL